MSKSGESRFTIANPLSKNLDPASVVGLGQGLLGDLLGNGSPPSCRLVLVSGWRGSPCQSRTLSHWRSGCGEHRLCTLPCLQGSGYENRGERGAHLLRGHARASCSSIPPLRPSLRVLTAWRSEGHQPSPPNDLPVPLHASKRFNSCLS